MKGRPVGFTSGAGDPRADATAEGDPLSVPLGEALGLVTVPNGVDEASGVELVPGAGVGVAGPGIGRGVGLGVAVGLGGGVGAGVGVGAGGGVGAVTTTVGPAADGFVPLVLTDVNVTGQLPADSVLDPVHVPFRRSPLASDSGNELPGTDALTLLALSEGLPMKCTLNTNTVAVVPVSGVTVG